MESMHTHLQAEPVSGCVIDYLSERGIACAAYTCSCGVLAARDNDGIINIAEASCEQLLFDAVEQDFGEGA